METRVTWEPVAERFSKLPMDKGMTMKEIGKELLLPENKWQSGALYAWADICVKRGWMLRKDEGKVAAEFKRIKDYDPKHLWRFYQESLRGKKPNPQKATTSKAKTANLTTVMADVAELRETAKALVNQLDLLSETMGKIVKDLTGRSRL